MHDFAFLDPAVMLPATKPRRRPRASPRHQAAGDLKASFYVHAAIFTSTSIGGHNYVYVASSVTATQQTLSRVMIHAWIHDALFAVTTVTPLQVLS